MKGGKGPSLISIVSCGEAKKSPLKFLQPNAQPLDRCWRASGKPLAGSFLKERWAATLGG
jgi:hypothetical protein